MQLSKLQYILHISIAHPSVSITYFDRRAAHSAEQPLLPQVQIDGGEGGAGDTRIQKGVRHVEQPPLDGGHVVAVVADHLGQRHLADVVQLRLREPGERVVPLVPEPVALTQVPELDS